LSAESPTLCLLVISRRQDPVELFNGILRRQGVVAHCQWATDERGFHDALAKQRPELLLCVDPDDALLTAIAGLRDTHVAEVPLLVVRHAADEAQITADLLRGARDCVSMAQPQRLQAVLMRELRALRVEQALRGTMRAAQSCRRQLESVLTRSHDAILQVQEGIVVEANTAWLELYGAHGAEGSIVGLPVMDLFAEDSQTTLKAALVACLQGRWNAPTLRVKAQREDGEAFDVDLGLALGEREGERCVRLIVPARRADEQHIAQELTNATQRNGRTELPWRQACLEQVRQRLATPLPGGARYLACIRPDQFAAIERLLGPERSDEFVVVLAGLIRTLLLPNDIAGHFSGTGFLVLLERGTLRDAEGWCERLAEKLFRKDVTVDGKTLRATVTIGLAQVSRSKPELDASMLEALEAARRGRNNGGNQVVTTVPDLKADSQSVQDQQWVRSLKSALHENRFRLVQQPIAGLRSQEAGMSDLLVRMVGTEGEEILPSEFMPAAGRHDLVRHIDRWVLAAAMELAVERKPGCLFVRLSAQSVLDPTLLSWLDAQLAATHMDPQQLCLQVTEDAAAADMPSLRSLVSSLKERGLRFALEHARCEERTLQLATLLPLDFLKIDGSVVQALNTDEAARQRVRAATDFANSHHATTIAERVEDANTMAVLWHLGVHFLQGYLIQAPEEVVISSR
jgi:PAS domain S-box-containing protein